MMKTRIGRIVGGVGEMRKHLMPTNILYAPKIFILGKSYQDVQKKSIKMT